VIHLVGNVHQSHRDQDSGDVQVEVRDKKKHLVTEKVVRDLLQASLSPVSSLYYSRMMNPY
jgi:hypothetical protein